MIRVVLIGSGNVAVHLARALEKTESIRLVQHFSRTDRNKHYFSETIPHTKDMGSLVEADVYLIAVKDEAIEEVASQISDRKGLVLHTSGSISLSLSGQPRDMAFFIRFKPFRRTGSSTGKRFHLPWRHLRRMLWRSLGNWHPRSAIKSTRSIRHAERNSICLRFLPIIFRTTCLLWLKSFVRKTSSILSF